MNKNIIVNVHNSEFLSKMIQEFAFSKGYKWPDKEKEYWDSPIKRYGDMSAAIRLSPDKSLNYSYFDLYKNHSEYKDSIFIDANTELGKFWDLFKEPEYIIPEINGYKAEYKRDGKIVKFGCAEIPIGIFQYIKGNYLEGNRSIKSVTLNSGVVITKEDAMKIVEYISFKNKG